MTGQRNHYPNTSFRSKEVGAGDNGLFVWRGRQEGRRGLADTGAQAVFREADGARWQLTEGAACLTKERKASLQAGPLHAWLTASLLCPLALGPPFSCDPSSGSLA